MIPPNFAEPSRLAMLDVAVPCPRIAACGIRQEAGRQGNPACAERRRAAPLDKL